MKRLFLLLFALLITAFLHAQEGEIIYRDFEPDLGVENVNERLLVDLDQDGAVDFEMAIVILYSTMEQDIEIVSRSPWNYRFCYSIENENLYYDENDTIVPNQYWTAYDEPMYLMWFESPQEFMIGFRKIVDEKSYYAWARIYMYLSNNYTKAHAFVDKVAYCTIPDYLLRWGQTDLYANLKENASSSFATIHPNPTTGIVTVSGENLRQADVYDVVGQMVSSVKAGNGNLTVNISGQPAGVYFLNVTDQNGKHCVKKVVKH